MKKAMTLIRFLACAALTVVLLAGCTVAPTPTGTETPAPGPSDAPTVTIPDSYTVVRAFSSGGETLTAIRDLADALTAMSGDGFRLVTEVNAETDAEIIIGPAAHHGAYERCRAMEDETWSVSFENGVVYILGGSDAALRDAIAWFRETYVAGKTALILPEGLSKTVSAPPVILAVSPYEGYRYVGEHTPVFAA